MIRSLVDESAMSMIPNELLFEIFSMLDDRDHQAPVVVAQQHHDDEVTATSARPSSRSRTSSTATATNRCPM